MKTKNCWIYFWTCYFSKGGKQLQWVTEWKQETKWLKRPYGENSSRWGSKYWAKTHVNMFLDADGWNQWLSPHGDNLAYCQTRPVFPDQAGHAHWARPSSQFTTNQISAAPQRAPAFHFSDARRPFGEWKPNTPCGHWWGIMGIFLRGLWVGSIFWHGRFEVFNTEQRHFSGALSLRHTVKHSHTCASIMPYSSDTHTLTHLVLHRRAVYAVSVSVPGERVIAAEAELLSTGPTVCLIGISGRRSVEPARSSGGCLDKITRLFHIASIHSQVDRLLAF